MGKREELKTFFSNKFLNLKAKGKEISFFTSNPQEKFEKNDFNENKTKTVYRFCVEKELEALQNGDICHLGQTAFVCKLKPNTHSYNKNERYLHFFDSKEDAIRSIDQLGKKNYLCSFEIESSVLNRFKGYGYYHKNNLSHGYDEDFVYEKVKEYAIPISQFNTNTFKSFIPVEQLFSKSEDETKNDEETAKENLSSPVEDQEQGSETDIFIKNNPSQNKEILSSNNSFNEKDDFEQN